MALLEKSRLVMHYLKTTRIVCLISSLHKVQKTRLSAHWVQEVMCLHGRNITSDFCPLQISQGREKTASIIFNNIDEIILLGDFVELCLELLSIFLESGILLHGKPLINRQRGLAFSCSFHGFSYDSHSINPRLQQKHLVRSSIPT